MKKSFAIFARFWLFALLLVAGSRGNANPLPLGDIVCNLPGQTFAEVQREAERQTQAGRTPFYRSNAREELIFEGFIRVGAAPAEIAALSDDGASVYVDGQLVHSAKGRGQHLPNLSQSLHRLGSLAPNQRYRIRVEYSNILLTGPTDMDGITLFLFGGGGEVAELEPALRVAPEERAVPAGVGLPVRIWLAQTGNVPYQVTVSGPGRIEPATFTLREGQLQTVRVFPPSQHDIYDYVAQAEPQVASSSENQDNPGQVHGQHQQLFVLPAIRVLTATFAAVTAKQGVEKGGKEVVKWAKPRQTRPKPLKLRFVADSNIFMDRMDAAQRARIDITYLNNPRVVLYVPAAAVREVLLAGSPTQNARLTNGAGRAHIVRIRDGHAGRRAIWGSVPFIFP